MIKLQHFIFVVVAAVSMAFADGYAQTNLAGQTFANSNIGFNINDLAGVDIMMATQRDSLINVKEKDLGRKLTAQETAKIDEKFEEGKKIMAAFQKAVRMGITVSFKSASEIEMKMDTAIDDKPLKAAGVGWFQRNAMKAAFKMMPKSMKERYIRKGNLIIVSPNSDPDTLRLSGDGRQLLGKILKTPYILQRQ